MMPVLRTVVFAVLAAIMALAPAIADSPPDNTPVNAAEARSRALDGMDRLRSDIQTLNALKAAQTELLGWNRERLRSGVTPTVLGSRLCVDPAIRSWCARLPATFGSDPEGP